MKAFYLLTFTLLLTFTAHEQERFRRDYKQLVFTDDDEPEKSGNYNGHNIFIFNYNDNGDVMHITSARNHILYVRTSPIGEDQHESGEKYSYFKAIDENGDPVLIKIYNKEKYGVQIIGGLGEGENSYCFHFIDLE